MTALACIRVFIGADLAPDKIDALAPLVGRVGSAFLDTRWVWPRRHALAAPFAFVLADPRVRRLETEDLQALSAELQHRLFGDQGEGEVCLLMLEGDEAEILRFAAADNDTLGALLQGQDVDLGGRLSEITSDGFRTLLPESERGDMARPLHPALRAIPQSHRKKTTYWRGVYNKSRKVFVGSTVATHETKTQLGEDQIQLGDLEDLLTARQALRTLRSGVLFCPISFSCLMRPSLRDAYLPALDCFEPTDRPRLAVTIYDTPRQPSFSALRQIKALTAPYFAFIDLQVADPEFAVSALPRETFNSVTLRLPTAERRDRLAAMRTFLTKGDDYRRASVWQALASVDTAEEVLLASRSAAPFLSGQAVSALLTVPVGGLQASVEQLPLSDGFWHGAKRPRTLVRKGRVRADGCSATQYA